MKYVLFLSLTVSFLTCLTSKVWSEESQSHETLIRPNMPDVSAEQGLRAWSRIHKVLSHPRCVNCHTDEKHLPMWSGPEFNGAQAHGMHIKAGESRIGVEHVPCQSCHLTSTQPNAVAHAAPHTGMLWRLAPVEFVWFEIPEVQICHQLRTPDTNGGHDGEGLIEHILHDAEKKGFITWGFSPGAGREPAPGTLQSHLNDIVMWVAAGMPCPD